MSEICSAKGLAELACELDEFLACSWSRQTCHWSEFSEFFLDTFQFQGFYWEGEDLTKHIRIFFCVT